jgi:hypothetical protein
MVFAPDPLDGRMAQSLLARHHADTPVPAGVHRMMAEDRLQVRDRVERGSTGDLRRSLRPSSSPAVLLWRAREVALAEYSPPCHFTRSRLARTH